MSTPENDPDADFADLVPALDEAINQLGYEDRTAILLRFFERRNLRSIGEALGSSENAAQKRVERALEQLHTILKRRGMALSSATLGTVMAAHAVTAAPTGLAATIATTVLSGAAVGGGTALTFLTMTKLKAILIASLLVGGLSTSLVVQRNLLAKRQSDNVALFERSQDLENRLDQIQQQNRQLSKLKVDWDELQSLRKDSLDLPRLRGKVSRLVRDNTDLTNALKAANAREGEFATGSTGTNQTASQLSFKAATARNSGFATVPATLQTVTWAALAGTPDDICRLEGQAATAADANPTPGKDRIVQFYQNLFRAVDSIQVVDMTPKSDGSMNVLLQLNSATLNASDSPGGPIRLESPLNSPVRHDFGSRSTTLHDACLVASLTLKITLAFRFCG